MASLLWTVFSLRPASRRARAAHARRSAAVIAAALVLPALGGCATDPWSMRDYATVIEQSRRIGAGTWGPAERPSPKDQTPGTSVTLPCVSNGSQLGTYTRTVKEDGTWSYSFSDDCTEETRADVRRR